MALIDEIKRVRKSLGKTQEQMAKSIGISRGHYNGVELGRLTPSYDLLQKIEDVSGTRLLILYIDK